MTYFTIFLGFSFIAGVVAVASNPSPYYGVMGLVVGSVVGCGWLVSLGVSFISLVLFLVYLGGMLVVFVYAVSLAADVHPEAWGSWRVMGCGVGFVVVVLVGLVVGGVEGDMVGVVETVDSGGMALVRVDFGGVAMFYSLGAWLLMVVGWGLLVSLFVVLELVRGVCRGTIRAV